MALTLFAFASPLGNTIVHGITQSINVKFLRAVKSTDISIHCLVFKCTHTHFYSHLERERARKKRINICLRERECVCVCNSLADRFSISHRQPIFLHSNTILITILTVTFPSDYLRYHMRSRFALFSSRYLHCVDSTLFFSLLSHSPQ